MPVPAMSLEAARRPSVGKFGAMFQRLSGVLAERSVVESEKPRSVADLLEFGYSVSSADRRFPHMPA